MGKSIDLKLKPGWRYDVGQGVFARSQGRNGGTGLAAAGARIVYKVPTLAQRPARSLSAAERDLSRYLQVIPSFRARTGKAGVSGANLARHRRCPRRAGDEPSANRQGKRRPQTRPLFSGTAGAFVTTPEDPEINQPTIDYVAAFLPEATGKKFNPHVTIGVAPQDYLKEMLAEPFDVFTFSPASASVYQLGNFGTARKELKALNPEPVSGNYRAPDHFAGWTLLSRRNNQSAGSIASLAAVALDNVRYGSLAPFRAMSAFPIAVIRLCGQDVPLSAKSGYSGRGH